MSYSRAADSGLPYRLCLAPQRAPAPLPLGVVLHRPREVELPREDAVLCGAGRANAGAEAAAAAADGGDSRAHGARGVRRDLIQQGLEPT